MNFTLLGGVFFNQIDIKKKIYVTRSHDVLFNN